MAILSHIVINYRGKSQQISGLLHGVSLTCTARCPSPPAAPMMVIHSPGRVSAYVDDDVEIEERVRG